MGHKQYCVYNGTAKVMPAKGLELMKARCSYLLEGGATEFCCNSDQVNKENLLFTYNKFDRNI